MAKWQNSWRRENPPGGACWAHTADNHWPHSSSHHAEHASRSLSVITHLHHTQTLHPLRFPVQPWETPASSTPNGWHLRLLQKGKLGKRCFWDGWVCIPHTDLMFHIWWQNKCVFLSVFSVFFHKPFVVVFMQRWIKQVEDESCSASVEDGTESTSSQQSTSSRSTPNPLSSGNCFHTSIWLRKHQS